MLSDTVASSIAAEEKPLSAKASVAETDSAASDTASESEPDDQSPALTPSATAKSTTPTKSLEPSSHNVEKTGKSLRERAKIPPSIYLTVVTTCGLGFLSGVWNENMFARWLKSMSASMSKSADLTLYLCRVLQGEEHLLELKDYLRLGMTVAMLLSATYVFLVAPFRKGLWTSREKIHKHKVHRYMGLFFLIQYSMAWVEYITNYEEAKRSVVPHFVAMNGIVQGLSAFLSFRVLPELTDPGFFSDVAVISRNFIHENLFFQIMCVFGSVYYYDGARMALRSSVFGRLLEKTLVFFPYVVLRPFFPITHFKDAGTSKQGRTDGNKTYYTYGTQLVKIFYLWAKYFLGFFINFLVYRNKLTEENWKFIQGLILLNIGTVSLAIFLHTLRFKKILPPRVTFTTYMLQIYATFSAIPYAYNLFQEHRGLCAFVMFGMLCNMTRRYEVHAAWCVLSLYLMDGHVNFDW